jgi:hypothetical protein
VPGNIRTSPLPSAEVDSTGKVYVVWQDCRFRSGCSNNDIVMTTSTDGSTWTPAVRIPIVGTSSTATFFIPGLAVDRNTGGASAHLGLTTYGYPNSSCGSTTCKLLALFVSSTDGGATWSRPKKVLGPLTLTWLPLTSQGYMVGDYISTSFLGGKAFPVISNATAGTCQLSQVGSCHEFMVTPTGGLLGTGPTVKAGLDRPVAARAASAVRKTAF